MISSIGFRGFSSPKPCNPCDVKFRGSSACSPKQFFADLKPIKIEDIKLGDSIVYTPNDLEGVAIPGTVIKVNSERILLKSEFVDIPILKNNPNGSLKIIGDMDGGTDGKMNLYPREVRNRNSRILN